jgi:hypothetical protein
MDIRTVSSILKRRAYIFTCSYKTAWENWLTVEEKQGFTYKEIIQYITLKGVKFK